MSIRVETAGSSIRIQLKVVPNASRTRVVGEYQGALKVAVATPPEKGRANEAVIELLARSLGLRRNQLTIESGTTSARKTLSITGVNADAMKRALESLLGGPDGAARK
jgi:uncharacterized protein (TIGR00251 family)